MGAFAGTDMSRKRMGIAEALRARTGPVIQNRYVLGRTLGETATSAVIEAVDRRMRRAIAVKLFEPDTGRRGSAFAAAEARLAALDHPNLCDVLDVDEQNGIPIVILERLHGETLADLLARGERLEVDHAMELFMQLLSALDVVHERGIVHRDVKPANVFLVPRAGCLPVVKLFDFAMSLDRNAPATKAPRTIVGTPAYMAPEQANGEIATLDGRADLYAVGIMLFEAVVGRRPFTAASHEAVLASRTVRSAVDIRQLAPDLPEVLAAVITRALAPIRERRFATAREMQNALCSAPCSGLIRADGPQSATRIDVPGARRSRPDVEPPHVDRGSVTLAVRYSPEVPHDDTVTVRRAR